MLMQAAGLGRGSASMGLRRQHAVAPHGSSWTPLLLRCAAAAGVKPEELDLIVMATSSPDDIFGSATSVQVRLAAQRQQQRWQQQQWQAAAAVAGSSSSGSNTASNVCYCPVPVGPLCLLIAAAAERRGCVL